jgi:hypothetical protein
VNKIECKARLADHHELNDENENIIINFTIPRDDPTNACIKMDCSFTFEATYLAYAPVNNF